MPFYKFCNLIFADRNNRGGSTLLKKKIRHFSNGRGPGGCSTRIYREYLFLKRFLFNSSYIR